MKDLILLGEALTEFNDAFQDTLLISTIAENMSCREVEALAAVLRASGHDDVAQMWIGSHAAYDVDGDRHYRPAPEPETRVDHRFGDLLVRAMGIGLTATYHGTIRVRDAVGEYLYDDFTVKLSCHDRRAEFPWKQGMAYAGREPEAGMILDSLLDDAHKYLTEPAEFHAQFGGGETVPCKEASAAIERFFELVGGDVVCALRDDGVETLVVVRDPARAPEWTPPGTFDVVHVGSGTVLSRHTGQEGRREADQAAEHWNSRPEHVRAILRVHARSTESNHRQEGGAA
ncbi:hypothetical protein [Nocardia puris]|uniref:Uncharacterized protein n=1 Tax=Nocardia puris TaxID=208602 RepID=A0A366DML7_9NOCA|nr:hypothetical protein [Nocardia puris]RBO91311.1 hypothetical protein DFR74_10413 [Nocardia puris]